MNLRELRYLVAVADYKHFGRAADACCVSQPTLSMQLKKLEEYLGVALFERTNRSVHITAIGHNIIDRARETLVNADSILELAKQGGAPLNTTLNLGIIPTLCPYTIPWLIPTLKAAFPKLRLVLHEDLTANLVERLAGHHIDAAILSLPVLRDGLESLSLFDEPFWFACPKDHALAAAETITDVELASEHILVLTDGHCLRDQMLAVCDAAHVQIDEDDFRATSLESIRQMVGAGMGCTLMPALAVDHLNAALAFRPLADQASRRIGLIWRHGFGKENDLRLMAKTIQDNLPASVHAAFGNESHDSATLSFQ